VGAEQQRGLAAPRHPGHQQVAGIHFGLGAQPLKGAGEVLQGRLCKLWGRPGTLK
jgi:hypothetical protein